MTQPPQGPYGGGPQGPYGGESQGPYGDGPRRRRDPDEMESRGARANAVIRLGGLVVIVLAFLGVSQSFTGGKKSGSATTPTSTTATTPTRAAVVYADAALEPVLRKIAPNASYTFGDADRLQQQLAGGATADVFLSGSKPAMRTLMAAGRCTTPVAFAIKPLYSSCQVKRADADAVVATAYVDGLTTFSAREILIDAGIDVPVTR